MLKNSLQDLWYFGIANIKNCFFPAIIFGSLAFSRLIAVPAIPRYDLLLLICLFTQWWMIRKGIESLDELKVITVFHLMGLTMELFKVWKGSWAYPEDALTKFGGVPLYSGFMYASVASYLCQAWRRFNLQLLNAPRRFESLVIAVLIYLNFFTHHYFYDLRWLLAVGSLVLYRKTIVSFSLKNSVYKMPMAAALMLIGFFVWIAENIATFFGAWEYAHQHNGWQMVSYQKVSSWMLMVVVSFIIVAELKWVKERRAVSAPEGKLEWEEALYE